MSLVRLRNVLLSGIFTLIFGSLAQALTLDSFDGTGLAEASPETQVVYATVASSSAVGGYRGMRSQYLSGPLRVRVETVLGTLNHAQDGNTKGKSLVTWDGDSDPGVLVFDGLGGLDLTQDDGTALQLEIVYFDWAGSKPLPVTVTLYDASDPSGARYSKHTVVLDQLIEVTQMLSIPFTDFTQHGPGGAVDFHNIGAVSLFIDGSIDPSFDLILDSLGTNGRCDIVPDQSGRVVDDCGVCGGNNEDKDVCGLCFGDGSRCLDCAGVPNGGATDDVCGICEGDGTSCLDCNDVPNGPSQPDRCGVCNGDGWSCCVCEEQDNSQTLAQMRRRSQAQCAHNVKVVKNCTQLGKQKRKKTLATNTRLCSQLNAIIASIPETTKICEPSPFCTEVSTSKVWQVSYNLSAVRVSKLTKGLCKPVQTGGPCTRTPAECAKSARKLNTDSTASKLLVANRNASGKLPDKRSVCIPP